MTIRRATKKEFAGYWKARREWISENDNYNVSMFSMSKARFYELNSAYMDEVGICGGSVTLPQLNKRIDRINDAR